MTYADGGSTSSSTKYAAIAGTMVLGYDAALNISWGQMNEGLPNSNISSYTGVSFDMRGQMMGFRALAIQGNSPIQDHNANCVFSGTIVPACAIDQGTVIAGVTDGYSGSAPDIGAFESNVAPFVPGAQRSADANTCGKLADITVTLPTRAPSPWAPASEPDSGADDAGVSDASVGYAGTVGTQPDAGSAGAIVGGGSCGCKVVVVRSTAYGLSSSWTPLALASILALARRRRN
jgi:hypothetical protein